MPKPYQGLPRLTIYTDEATVERLRALGAEHRLPISRVCQAALRYAADKKTFHRELDKESRRLWAYGQRLSRRAGGSNG